MRIKLFSAVLISAVLVSCHADTHHEVPSAEPETTPNIITQTPVVRENEKPEENTVLYTNPEEDEPQVTEWPIPPETLTTENLLYDLEYLINILEENFPYYNIARRKLGVDLHKQAEIARNAVLNLSISGNNDQTLRRFADILNVNITTPMRTMGHLRGLWADSNAHKVQLALILRDSNRDTPNLPNLYRDYMLGMFTSPAANRYYKQSPDDINIDALIRSLYVPDSITFDIISPNSVAYMHISSMYFIGSDRDRERIAAFGNSLEGYEHLIIDLRGNRGGNAYNFIEYILSPLVKRPVSFNYYVFFKGGGHAEFFDDIYVRDAEWQIKHGIDEIFRDGPRFPAVDKLSTLPRANSDDFIGIDYGFLREIAVTPSSNPWPFDGKVWVLIDGLSISAAEISAAVAAESDNVTLVGSPTAGIFGGYTAAFVCLPNTGIIIRYDYGYVTDLQGRSIEEFGIAPHVYNRSGMDALQTVLALIHEGG
jgi:hypothetical protein